MKTLYKYGNKIKLNTSGFLNPINLKMFCGLLKNKDQKGDSDKSYSGTDSKHILGSDRIIQDKERKTLTTPVDDTTTHDHYIKQTKEDEKLKIFLKTDEKNKDDNNKDDKNKDMKNKDEKNKDMKNKDESNTDIF